MRYMYGTIWYYTLYCIGDIVRTILGDQVKLLAYDHNWDEPSYPLDVLAHSADPHTFAGTAWHCYGGEMATAMDMLQEEFPGYEQHVTECTGSYPDGTCDITKGIRGIIVEFMYIVI